MGTYKRGSVWWFSYFLHGQQIRESSGSTNKRVAEKLLALRRAQVLEDRWNLPKTNAPRLKAWADQFLQSVTHINTRSRYQASVNNLIEFLGNAKISEITPVWICCFQQARLQAGVRSATVNRDVAALSVMLSKARKSRLITRNPCTDADKLEERRERRQAKPLTYEEEAALKAKCPTWLWMLIFFLIETGLRAKKEALPLRWSDLDLESERGCVYVRDSKTPAGTRRVWLTCDCRNELLRWRTFIGPAYSEYVFPALSNPARHLTDYRHAWEKAVRAAGLRDRRVYDLRATFATRANQAKATSLTLAQLLGHSSTTILPTYAKPMDENTRAVIEGLEELRAAHERRPVVQ